MVVGRCRQRNQHRWPSRRGQLRQRGCASAANDDIGGFHLPVHGEEKRLDPGFEPGAAIPVADVFQVALSCLMRDCQPAGVGCQPRRRLHHGHVDRVRALGAPKDQNPRRAVSGRRNCLLEELGTNRIPCDKAPPPEVRQRRLERDSRGADKRRQPAIGKTWHRVLLQQKRGDASERGHENNRPRTVAADTDHQPWRPA